MEHSNELSSAYKNRAHLWLRECSKRNITTYTGRHIQVGGHLWPGRMRKCGGPSSLSGTDLSPSPPRAAQQTDEPLLWLLW
mmetsp:Transcript_18926/g.40754  ORF Transcript_18926/g.40754 Transcript_18926/m.40754 type:complete len:81 (-) Transcript_18926:474-716(-)